MTVDSTSGAGSGERACGFVALIGAPNVGKSTLVNALVGSKVTIVSRKVQTTRALIRGIVIENNSQIILVDTPGPRDAGVQLGNAAGVLPYSVLISADGVLLRQRIGPFAPGEIGRWSRP